MNTLLTNTADILRSVNLEYVNFNKNAAFCYVYAFKEIIFSLFVVIYYPES